MTNDNRPGQNQPKSPQESSAGKHGEGRMISRQEFMRRRKPLNRALAFTLAGLCILFYLITIAKMAGSAAL